MTVLQTLVETGVLVFCVLDVALLARLWFSRRNGEVPQLAIVGVMVTVLGVAINHAVLVHETDRAFLAGSVVIGAGATALFVALLGIMDVGLFQSDWIRTTGHAQAVREEVERIGGVVDAIDQAVNSRVSGDASIGEDVASIEARGVRDDARRVRDKFW
jgi:hypothetical protein